MLTTKRLSWIALAVPFALLTPACATDDTDGDEPAVPEVSEAAQAVATTAFTATYTGQGAGANTCNTTFNISGQEPQPAGTYPVFIYMIGTTETFTNASASAAVAGMASRGFVAATVAYDSANFNNCATIQGKARCIFNPSSTTSVVSRLCSRAKADCSKGIVVGGFSQGSVMATQAKNFDSRVQAAWGMGDGIRYTTAFNLSSCQNNGAHALPANRLRSIVGQRDQFVGDGAFGVGAGTAANVRRQEQSLTGRNCGANAFNCLAADGSGWFIVQNNQVQDGAADHCFARRTGDCLGSENSLDQGWATGTQPWQLNANLDWLNGFVTH